jgi:very-long-chain enoyl-CoA reductase
MSSLTIAATGKSTLLRGLPVSLKLEKPADAATVVDVKAALAAKFPQVWSCLPLHSLDVSLTHGRAFQLYVERQKLSLKGEAKALDDNAILAAAGIRDGGELVVKDLGPQVSWRTVFLIEYVRFSFISSPACSRHYFEKKKKRGCPS